MAGIKTDNHYTADKIALRASLTEHLDTVKVLDLFGGHGVVWQGVARQTGKQIDRVAVNSRLDLDSFHLHGDNRKILPSIDLSDFDVIDIDAYGIPAAQILEVVCDRQFRGVVFVTAIQTMQGGMPKIIAEKIGLPPTLSTACNSLIGRRGWEYLKAWLAEIGVKTIWHRSKGRKHYFGFYANGYAPPERP